MKWLHMNYIIHTYTGDGWSVIDRYTCGYWHACYTYALQQEQAKEREFLRQKAMSERRR